MVSILAVNSSPGLSFSITRQLVHSFLEAYTMARPDSVVIERDIGKEPPPHLTERVIGAYFTPPDAYSSEQKLAIALSNQLIDEILAADLIIIGAPMHNFGITSGLKAYIDHIVRAGRTFSFSAEGPVGLVKDKKVVVITSRGSDYSQGSPLAALDHQENHLRSIFAFIGMTDVTFMHCQGTAVSEEARNGAIAHVRSHIASNAHLI
jgi:FMN-dependent NADH-azoreductase